MVTSVVIFWLFTFPFKDSAYVPSWVGIISDKYVPASSSEGMKLTSFVTPPNCTLTVISFIAFLIGVSLFSWNINNRLFKLLSNGGSVSQPAVIVILPT